jgi:hypothetical protein
MCQDQKVCPDDYRLQGNWMFFCKGKQIRELNLLYYTLLHDGEGNPVITDNHSEAVSAGISYFLLKQGAFRGKVAGGMLREYKDEYYDRLGEARGDDAWPNTVEEWEKLGLILNRSYRDTLIYSKIKRCFCEVSEAELTSEIDAGGTTGGGGGYTNPDNEVPGGGGAGTGSGGSTDGDGSYEEPDVVDPVDPVDPEPEPGNQEPTIDDITFYTTEGHTTIVTWSMFVDGAPAPYNDPENDLMDAVRLDGLKFNNKGKWFYQGMEVGVDLAFGEILFKTNFDANELIHIAWNENDFNEDILYFSVRDTVNGNWVN